MGAKYRDLVRNHSKARGSARAVLNALADYATDEGFAWPGRAQLASDTGMSERNVIRCIQALCNDARLSIEENALGGRGNKPTYKIWFPELGEPAPVNKSKEHVKGDKLSPYKDDKRVTNASIKGDKLSRKGDKSVGNPSYARIEPHEPHKEPERESAPPPAKIVSSGVNGAKPRRIDSPYLKGSKFVNGYIPPGTGRNAVEVYYERFPINLDKWRLSDPQEDDLVTGCKDLKLLREVVTAYDQANYEKPRNLKLIMDWYREPQRFRNNHNGNHKGSNTEGYRKPETSQHSMADHKAVDAKRRAEGIPY